MSSSINTTENKNVVNFSFRDLVASLARLKIDKNLLQKMFSNLHAKESYNLLDSFFKSANFREVVCFFELVFITDFLPRSGKIRFKNSLAKLVN